MKLALQFLILPALLFTASAALSAPHIHKEAFYRDLWCQVNHGDTEQRQPNGTIADCSSTRPVRSESNVVSLKGRLRSISDSILICCGVLVLWLLFRGNNHRDLGPHFLPGPSSGISSESLKNFCQGPSLTPFGFLPLRGPMEIQKKISGIISRAGNRKRQN